MKDPSTDTASNDTRSHAICHEREEGWIELVRHLYESGGAAPDWNARGMWVDLFDEATKDWEPDW